jgi:hypothetical protein
MFQLLVAPQFGNRIRKKFEDLAKNMEYNKSDYQISVRTTPPMHIEENVIKTLVVYSNGTVWLNLIKDAEEVNRILPLISPKARIASKRDLIRLCGEGGLSRWSYIRKVTAVDLREFESKMRQLIDSKQYASARTKCVLGSFGLKYEERRFLELHIKPNGISADVSVKDLFSQETDLLETIEDFLLIDKT